MNLDGEDIVTHHRGTENIGNIRYTFGILDGRGGRVGRPRREAKPADVVAVEVNRVSVIDVIGGEQRIAGELIAPLKMRPIINGEVTI